MGLTRLQLLDRVRNRLSVTSDDAILTQTVLYECINDGIQAFADERNWPWLEAVGTVSLTAGTASYALPADFIRIHVADIDGAELEYVQYSDFLRDRFTNSRQPRKFTIVGGTIHVSPTPDTAYTLNLWYQRAERALGNDTDETYAPDRRAALLATYAAIYAAAKLRDVDLIRSLTVLRDDDLKRAVDDVQRGTAGPSIMTRRDNHA